MKKTGFQEQFLIYVENEETIFDWKNLKNLINLFTEKNDFGFLLLKINDFGENSNLYYQQSLAVLKEILENNKIIKEVNKDQIKLVLNDLLAIWDIYEKKRIIWVLLELYTDIKDVKFLYSGTERNQDLINLFLKKSIELNNQEFFIEIFYTFLDNEYDYFYSYKDFFDYFSNINDKKLISSFYKKINKNTSGYILINLLKLDKDCISIFLKKLEILNDNKIDNSFKEILILIIENIQNNKYYYVDIEAYESEFTIQLFNYLKAKFDIVTEILSNSQGKNIYWDWKIIDLFWENIKIGEIKNIVKIIDNDRYTDVYIYEYIEKTEREDKKVILEEFEKLIWDKINIRKTELEKGRQEHLEYIKKRNEEKRLEIETLFKDLPEESISPKLIYMFLSNKADFTDSERGIIEKWVRLFFTWNLLDPNKDNLISLQKENWTKNVEWHIGDNTFSNCLNLAIKEFRIDISKIKDKLIRFIPFAYSEDLKLIFDVITNLNKEDINIILKSYSITRKDYLRYYQPYNFIEVFNKYKNNFEEFLLDETIELLKSFVEDTNIEINYRIKEKSLIFLKDQNVLKKDYFQELFKKNIGNNINYFKDILKNQTELSEENRTNFELAVLVNKILIEKFKDKNAIEWRFNQLLNWEIVEVDNSQYSGMRNISKSGKELEFDYNFIKPLGQLKWKQYLNNILALLEKSFKLDENYIVYIRYAQKWILDFFKKNRHVSLANKKSILDLANKYGNQVFIRSFARIEDLIKIDKKRDRLSKKIHIITEWKTDWKYLMGSRNLFKDRYEKWDFDKVVFKDENRYWWSDAIYILKYTPPIHPDKLYIGILDKDKLSDINDICKICDESEIKNLQKVPNFLKNKNCYFIFTPFPEHRKEHSFDYKSKWTCMELNYTNEEINNKLILWEVLHDIKESNNIKFSSNKQIPYYEYNWYYLKLNKWWNNKSIYDFSEISEGKIKIHDSNFKLLFPLDKNKNEEDINLKVDYRKIFFAKNDFANEIIQWNINISHGSHLRFKKIFDLIDKCIEDYIENNKF